ncbi:MAG: TRAP transporter small permease [Burkholderiaceae bacterium]
MRSALERISRVNVLLGAASGIATLAMILLIVPDVLLRKMAGVTIPGASEASVLLLVLLAYLGMAGAQAKQAHFSADFLILRLPPGWRHGLRIVVLVLSLVFVLAVGWLAVGSAWESTLRGEASFGIVQFPIWPSRIAVALGFTLLALQLAVDICRAWLGDLPNPPSGDFAD